ncbi:cytochrome P450, partial [Candidatus Bathyarchaeota archaeon]|nr:cytochrome P450 [Candidatus Bathyarchaeota archaeon]
MTYHLLDKPEMYKRLMKDLESIDFANLKWTELEQRPYMWAIIHESLRMMPGVSHRSARTAPEEDLVFKQRDGKKEWVITRGSKFFPQIPFPLDAPRLANKDRAA